MKRDTIPYNDIKTIFLDAGNTLVSMDFEWILHTLEPFGLSCTVDQLIRAEAASRPVVSKELVRLKSTESGDTFRFYVKTILEKLPENTLPDRENKVHILNAILPILKAPGLATRLWSYILPGVPEALTILNDKGFQLAVVSNSDGSVEKGLHDIGLGKYFQAIIDSHVFGYEKPDPRLFKRALTMCDTDPNQTIHVGDMYDTDVIGARSAGIHAVLLDPYNDWDVHDCPSHPDILSFARFLKKRREYR